MSQTASVLFYFYFLTRLLFFVVVVLLFLCVCVFFMCVCVLLLLLFFLGVWLLVLFKDDFIIAAFRSFWLSQFQSVASTFLLRHLYRKHRGGLLNMIFVVVVVVLLSVWLLIQFQDAFITTIL